MFDSRTAFHVLMEWLPRVTDPGVKETITRRLAESGKRSETAQALIQEALRRIKTDASREVVLQRIGDPDVCTHAMYALRRLDGNEEARRQIEPLLEHESEDVRRIAAKTLRRINKALAR
jgi:HEAT repeat protein